jgi:hypothetical protein
VLALAFPALCGDAAPSAASQKADKAVAPVKKAQDESRIWVSPEYFGLVGGDSAYPKFPLVTRGDIASFNGGILGDPGTTVLFDRDSTDFGIQHGFKLDVGGWLDEGRKWGAEISGFLIPEVSEKNTFAWDGVNRLAIPYFNTSNSNPGFPVFLPIGEAMAFFDSGVLPSLRSASVAVSNRQEFWGVGPHGLLNVHRGDVVGIDAKFGFQFASLQDEFKFKREFNFGLGFPVLFSDIGAFENAAMKSVDSFKGTNRFYGADLGARFHFKSGRFRAEVAPRLALGAVTQKVEIRGVSSALDLDTGLVYTYARGGFWAQDTNIGEHTRTRFGVIPGVDLKFGVEICKHLDFHAGYSVTYWNSVVRGGQHVSRYTNSDKIAIGGLFTPTYPSAEPSFKWKTTDFLAHGVTAGFTVKF